MATGASLGLPMSLYGTPCIIQKMQSAFTIRYKFWQIDCWNSKLAENDEKMLCFPSTAVAQANVFP